MFILKSAHTAIVAVLKDQLARADARVSVVEQQLAESHALLLKANEPPAPLVLPTRPEDKVMDAVSVKAGANGPLRGYLARYVREQRLLGKPDDLLVEEVLDWSKAVPAESALDFLGL